MSFLTQRVAEVPPHGDRLLGPRDALTPNRAVGIGGIAKR